MKKIFIVLAIVSFMVVIPMYGNAGIIGNVSLTESAGGPSATVYFATLGTVTGYLDYNVSINGGPSMLAFCVEGAWAPTTSNTPYTMISIDSGLGFDLDPARYLAASWIAQTYGTTQREAAQIAIWEVVTDGASSPNLAAGNFRSTSSSYNAAAASILSHLGSDTSWVLLVNPTVTDGQTIGIQDTQNYIARVPEPGTLILMGSGLLGLVAAGRKKFRK